MRKIFEVIVEFCHTEEVVAENEHEAEEKVLDDLMDDAGNIILNERHVKVSIRDIESESSTEAFLKKLEFLIEDTPDAPVIVTTTTGEEYGVKAVSGEETIRIYTTDKDNTTTAIELQKELENVAHHQDIEIVAGDKFFQIDDIEVDMCPSPGMDKLIIHVKPDTL